jgi:hypothetical protein
MISGKARAHRTSAQVVACSFKMVRVTGSGKFTKAVSKKLHVEDAEDNAEDKDEADSDKEEETVKDDEQENADGSDDEEEAGGSDDDEDDEDVELEDEDEDDGLGGSDNDDEEEEEGAVKTGKSRKRNVFIDDAAEVSSRPEPTRVIPLAAVQFQRRVNIAAA